ncbi:hypothetical protein [Amycolatopsis sp. NPDC004625]|uniref:hypothetical protein n=1 Tax=Amycolatopsis sp. NPDC004625 TaxID=3154670 RepID=UPI0033A6EFB3
MNFWDWVSTWQLGNVPSWFSGVSLVLALWIIVRDRRHRIRGQVESVGVWGAVSIKGSIRDLRDDSTDELDTAGEPQFVITPHVTAKNSSDLPVEIAAIEYIAEYSWREKVGEDQWKILEPPERFKSIGGRGTVLPGETVDIVRDVGTVLDDGKPANAHVLSPRGRLIIRAVYVTDSVGRRWKMRPTSGKEPRRIRTLGFYLFLLKFPSPFHEWHTRRSSKFAYAVRAVPVLRQRVRDWFKRGQGGA